jgi:hypothetical protein
MLVVAWRRAARRSWLAPECCTTAACGMRASRQPAAAWAGSSAWETGGRDQTTGEAETAGDHESRREDWGWGLDVTERGLGTLFGARGDSVRRQRRGGDGHESLLCCAGKFGLKVKLLVQLIVVALLKSTITSTENSNNAFVQVAVGTVGLSFALFRHSNGR